jgi:hypothetical protein
MSLSAPRRSSRSLPLICVLLGGTACSSTLHAPSAANTGADAAMNARDASQPNLVAPKLPDDASTRHDGGAKSAQHAVADASADASVSPAHPQHDAGSISRTDASAGDASVARDIDRFGVKKLIATIAGGREWYLPDDAESSSDEWNVETNPVSRVSNGLFHTVGNNGETRLTVGSPSGKAWWRNVEMTGYYRYTAPMDSYDQERHFELVARSERHSDNAVAGADINGGVAAPAGTATWPGYPYATDASIDPHCLGASYHGNFYLTGHGLFEKEVSHADGYASQRSETAAGGFADPLNRWFGYKFILRNQAANTSVHMELWLDANANGRWEKLAEADDKTGWSASDASINGCTDAPFSYTPDQLITWAGPWIVFRSDSVAIDFRWLSAREIAPLP